MKLFCFPFAGASSAVFLQYKQYFDGITLIPIDPPGRGKRIAEPLCKTIKEMVYDLKNQLLSLVEQGEDYAVFGHSMGSLLIFELLHELMDTGFHLPVHVFMSGKNPPHIPIKNTIRQLSDDEFVKKIVAIGGMEAQFFENPVLAKLFIPILRADFGVLEEYDYQEKKQLLPIDITFFFCTDDKAINSKYVKQWSDYITGSFRMFHFKGGHFFIHEKAKEISRIIKDTLLETEIIIPY